MDTNSIIAQVRAERDRLNKVLELLEGSPAATTTKSAKKSGHKISPEVRAKISAAAKKKWAERKKQAAKGTK